jgi:putative CocE/NonD family hydrolase
VRTNQFVIVGPWGHGLGGRKLGELDFGPDAPLKLSQRQDQWNEHWLRGVDRGIGQWPPYFLFVMGENRWRAEREWPLARTRFTPFYLGGSGHANSLRGDGTLAVDRPARRGGAPDRFVYDGNHPVPTKGGNNLVGATAGPEDQTEVESRDDVLVYTTAPLEADLEVTGPVRLILWASSSARDTDFTGKLVDVHPDGKAYNLCEGIQRARYRRGTDRESLLTPGKRERFEIDLWVTSNVFLRGHRVRLEVSSSNFPRFDRNPNTGNPFGSDATLRPATQTILHDRAHPSHLLLPVIPR